MDQQASEHGEEEKSQAMSSKLPSPRREVARLQSDSHGGPDYAELAALGMGPEDVLDFSASTNAFGPPPGVAGALASCDLSRYPDRHAEPLRGALAGYEGVAAEQVLPANGAAQLIWSIAMAYLSPGDTAAVLGPTFGEYRVASALMGARVLDLSAEARDGFRPDLPALCERLAACKPRLAWLCNPNNPTGVYLKEKAVVELLAAAQGTLWVIDEAYRPFVCGPWHTLGLASGTGNVVLLRSLTKDCSVPGLRLGYALGPEPIIAALYRTLPPWSVSSPAIAAGLAALPGIGRVRDQLADLRVSAEQLRAELSAQGWPVLPSATHFFLIEVGEARSVRARLLREHHLQVRDCTSFGLPQFIRVAARTAEDNARLCCAMGTLR